MRSKKEQGSSACISFPDFFLFLLCNLKHLICYRSTSSKQVAGADVDVNKDDLLREKELKVCLVLFLSLVLDILLCRKSKGFAVL